MFNEEVITLMLIFVITKISYSYRNGKCAYRYTGFRYEWYSHKFLLKFRRNRYEDFQEKGDNHGRL